MKIVKFINFKTVCFLLPHWDSRCFTKPELLIVDAAVKKEMCNRFHKFINWISTSRERQQKLCIAQSAVFRKIAAHIWFSSPSNKFHCFDAGARRCCEKQVDFKLKKLFTNTERLSLNKSKLVMAYWTTNLLKLISIQYRLQVSTFMKKY